MPYLKKASVTDPQQQDASSTCPTGTVTSELESWLGLCPRFNRLLNPQVPSLTWNLRSDLIQHIILHYKRNQEKLMLAAQEKLSRVTWTLKSKHILIYCTVLLQFPYSSEPVPDNTQRHHNVQWIISTSNTPTQLTRPTLNCTDTVFFDNYIKKAINTWSGSAFQIKPKCRPLSTINTCHN